MSTLAAARSPGAVRREHRRPRAAGARSAARPPARPQLVARHQGIPRGAAEPVRLLAAACCRFRTSRVARWINRWLLLRALRRWMRATGFYRPIVWTFLPTPLALDLIHAHRSAADDLLLHRRPRVELAGRAGGSCRARSGCSAKPTSCSSPPRSCAQRAARFSQRVHLFPFGVSFERFDAVRDGAAIRRRPTSRALPRPVVGYVGGLHQWVDQDLLAAVAAAACRTSASRWSGRRRPTSRRCSAAPNVHLLGQRPHPEVPHYVKAFDVGIVPYRLDGVHRQRLPDEAERVPGDGHSGRRDRSARDPALQRRPRRRRARRRRRRRVRGRRSARRSGDSTPAEARAAHRRRAREQLGEPHRRDDRR